MKHLHTAPRRLLLSLAGALTALPHILPAFAPVAWLLPAFCIVAIRNGSGNSGRDLFRGFLDAFGYFFFYHVVICHWFLKMDPSGVSGISGSGLVWVRVGGFLLLPAIYASLFSLAAPVYLLLRRMLSQRRDTWLIPVFPFCFSLAEWLQTAGWLGLPMGRLAAGQAFFLPAIQSASLFGSLFVGFLMWMVASLTAHAADTKICRGRRLAALAAAFLLFSGNLGFGWIRIGRSRGPESGGAVRVAALQGNISSAEKWGEMHYDEMLPRYLDLCENALEQGAKLIVLPETALPVYYNESPERLAPFAELAKRNQTDILIGGFFRRMNPDSSSVKHNAVYQIDASGGINHQPYFKRVLVPFGEYVPMRRFFSVICPPLLQLNMTGEDWAAGTEPCVFACDAGTVGALICYDSQYEKLTADSVGAGAQILAVCTNDSWFDGTGALNEHLAHSVLRAVESGRPVVRAANTGISAVIGTRGEILDRTAAGTTDLAIADIHPCSCQTVYARVGERWLWAGAVYLILLFGFRAVRVIRRKVTDRISKNGCRPA